MAILAQLWLYCCPFLADRFAIRRRACRPAPPNRQPENTEDGATAPDTRAVRVDAAQYRAAIGCDAPSEVTERAGDRGGKDAGDAAVKEAHSAGGPTHQDRDAGRCTVQCSMRLGRQHPWSALPSRPRLDSTWICRPHRPPPTRLDRPRIAASIQPDRRKRHAPQARSKSTDTTLSRHRLSSHQRSSTLHSHACLVYGFLGNAYGCALNCFHARWSRDRLLTILLTRAPPATPTPVFSISP